MEAYFSEEELELYRRLLRRGLAVLVPVDKVPRRPDGTPLAGGLFSVAKDLDHDRLIFDRRPQNATERRLNWICLPGAAQLQRIVLRYDQCLRGSGDDLRCVRPRCFGKGLVRS